MDERTMTLLGMKKLVYFPHNYGVYNAINAIWPGRENGHMREHLCGKLDDCGSDFFEFFLSLDAPNQRLVLEFVLDNYTGVKSV